MDKGELGFDSWQRERDLLFLIVFTLALRPIQPHLRETEVPSSAAKRMEHEAARSLPSGAKDNVYNTSNGKCPSHGVNKKQSQQLQTYRATIGVWSQDSLAMGYRLDGQGVGGRFLAGAGVITE
jgi:hypothetical protein